MIIGEIIHAMCGIIVVCALVSAWNTMEIATNTKIIRETVTQHAKEYNASIDTSSRLLNAQLP